MLGQHAAGQFRGGQGTLRQHGFPGDHQHLNSLDQSPYEQLAFFSIHKPLNARSWDDATPLRHRLSSSDTRKALAKMNQNPRKTVKDTLMNLKSDSARRVIDALVQEQNAKLSESDSTSEWIIAGLDVQKELVKQWPSQKWIIKSIEVILKTEPAPFAQDFDDDDHFEGGGPHLQQAHRSLFVRHLRWVISPFRCMGMIESLCPCVKSFRFHRTTIKEATFRVQEAMVTVKEVTIMVTSHMVRYQVRSIQEADHKLQ
ncbi:hypothetical protein SLS60_003798 [Paraconiothyrium brasiliense]|uniref:Uncharacterized protein n=1 Tax=Paraconiothyrium brasiliense TaxID=300254 RepID=A0ABR3RPN9_9PLEO